MVKKIRQALKNEKGLTLVELLAVVVILGIISAIAIPSIGGLINNSKKDAHIANAQQMVNSAKIALAENPDETSWTLGKLVSGDYIEKIKNPSGEAYGEAKGYHETESKVTKSDDKYYVILKQKSGESSVSIIDGSVEVSELKRTNVTLPK